MRWPRLRLSLRGMMIAVALTPIVLYAGFWAGAERAIIISVKSTPPLNETLESTKTEIFEVYWPATFVAMAATAAFLAAVWVLVARSIRRIKRA